MKITNQVCTLDQSKKLWELQIDGECKFIWLSEDLAEYTLEYCPLVTPKYKANYQAYTSAELGVMLIVEDSIHFSESLYDEHGGNWETVIYKVDDRFKEGFDIIYRGEGETEAEAKADALIWLIENNIQTYSNILDNLSN